MFIDDVLRYLKESENVSIQLPDWARKAFADKMSDEITGIQDNGDSIDVTSKSNGKTVKYNISKSGQIKEV